MAGKFYAVKKGVKPGIYNSWSICEKMVKGYPGAIFKSFQTYEEALAFCGIVDENSKTQVTDNSNSIDEKNIPYAFVDGSFNSVTNVYGYGGFLIFNNQKIVIKGNGSDEELASMRNVAGEILGCMAAIKKAIELGVKDILIYYDYMGIEMWANGSWKRNKQGTIEYHNFIVEARKKINIKFEKVKGHSGVEGNEEADTLAKEAVGLL